MLCLFGIKCTFLNIAWAKGLSQSFTIIYTKRPLKRQNDLYSNIPRINASIECISLSIIPHLWLCLLLWAGLRAAVSILHSSPPLSAQLPPSSHLQSLTPLTSRYLGQLFSFCKTCLFFADTMCKPSVPPAKVGCEMWYRLSVQQICDCSVECGVKISI